MDVFEAINDRRSVRKFTAENVDDKDLQRMLEAGQMAPSWVNFQVWEIITVRDNSTKEKLAATLSEKNPARRAVASAPVVLVACGRKGESGYKKGMATTVLGDWLMFDVALFLHNVTLAAHALGYGTVHVGLFDHVAVAELLGVPDTVQVVELLPIGRPLDPPKKAPRRRLVSEFIHEERY
ncbi:MAG: nitroreductase family protein [Myxococcota bacterium]|nr:nitroreductase family protein [Myxococcota bacterium]